MVRSLRDRTPTYSATITLFLSVRCFCDRDSEGSGSFGVAQGANRTQRSGGS
ncbi:MAG: hypothetical protein KME43_24690 [Myxacorys chilensis ATA2-1-KO14]|nr:hypothetical protein [Myxacorys chilensis ATA2-1-KO14]